MLELQPQGPSDEGCPKRQWVMLSLADDDPDAVDGTGGRTHFATAHLAHCQPCREMAERVRGVDAALHGAAKGALSESQVQSILSRGLEVVRDAHPVEESAVNEMHREARVSWRARMFHRLANPRPGRFGRAKRSMEPWQAIAAALLLVVTVGGYFAYQQFDLSGDAATAKPAVVNDGRPWVRVPTLDETGVSERLSEWQMKARSPFEKIQGWKGPVRRLDDADLNIEWNSESTVAAPLPSEESLGEVHDAKVAAKRNVLPPNGEVQPKSPAPVDSTTPAVLSKGFKDTR